MSDDRFLKDWELPDFDLGRLAQKIAVQTRSLPQVETLWVTFCRAFGISFKPAHALVPATGFAILLVVGFLSTSAPDAALDLSFFNVDETEVSWEI